MSGRRCRPGHLSASARSPGAGLSGPFLRASQPGTSQDVRTHHQACIGVTGLCTLLGQLHSRAHTAYSSSSSVLHRARLLQTYRRVLQPTVSGNALQQIQLHGELKHSSGRMSCVLLVTRPYGVCFNSPSQPWSDLRLACLWGLSAAALLCNYAASLFGLWVLRTLWRCP